ncbi:MAG: hypothetical protein U0230_14165 [Polyangiales bacterium]
MRVTTRFGLALSLALGGLVHGGASARAQTPIAVGDRFPLDVVAAPDLPNPVRRQSEARAASCGDTRLVVFRDLPIRYDTPVAPDDTLVAVRIRASDGAILGGTRIPLGAKDFANVTFDVGASASTYLIAFSSDGETVEGVRIRASDGSLLDSSPFTIGFHATSLPDEVTIASDGTSFLVAWTDFRNPSVTPTGANPDVFMNLVTSAGTVPDSSGKALANGLDHQYAPHLVWDGTSYVVVFGFEAGGSSSPSLRARRVSASGSATGSVVTVGTPYAYRFGADLAVGGGRIALVHGAASTATSPSITISLLGSDLAPVGSPIVVASTGYTRSGPDVAWNGSGFVTTWYTSGSSDRTDAQPWAVRFTSTGTLVDSARVALGPVVPYPEAHLFDDPPAFDGAIVALTGSRWLVAHPYFDTTTATSTYRMGAQLVDAAFPTTTPGVDAGTGGGSGGGGGGGVIVCSASPGAHGGPGATAWLVLVAALGLRGMRRLRGPGRA